MDMPKGLRKPHRIAALLPVVLAFVAFVAFAFAMFVYIAERGGATSTQATRPGAGTAPTLFQPEVLFVVGIVVLGVALAWGRWRANTRNRANDPVTDEATRRNYRRPEGQTENKTDLEDRLHRS